jgi:hypothetical protein
MVSLFFFFTCYRSVLVEVTELGVLHASIHIVCARTFSGLLWINMSEELYRLPYKTASSDRGLLEDTVRRSCERLIGFQDGAPVYVAPLVSACQCVLLRALLWLHDHLTSYHITFSI